MAQPGNLLLPQQLLGAERGAGVCTAGRVPCGGSVAEELLPVAKSFFNYHYYRDCLHHHNPAAGYSHQDAAGGAPLAAESSCAQKAAPWARSAPAACLGSLRGAAGRGTSWGTPRWVAKSGEDQSSAPHRGLCPACCARPRSPRCWRARDRQPQQSALPRGSFQGGGAETCFPLLFPFSCRLLPSA